MVKNHQLRPAILAFYQRGFSIDILVFSSVTPLFLYPFSSCWQVLFEDSLSTVWSAPNYCISEWHFPSWQGGREQWIKFLPHTPKKSILAPDNRNFPCRKEIPNFETITEWWFQFFLIFTPKFGEDEPILTSIFFRWVVQPPTRSETIMIFRKSKSTKLCRIRLGIGNPCSIHWIIHDQPATSLGRLGEFLGIILMVRPVGSEQLR